MFFVAFDRSQVLNRMASQVLRGILMDYITIVGLVAAALTVIAFFPQLMKVAKTRSTRDISLGMFSIFYAAVFLWSAYGILTSDPPVIIANVLVFAQALAILAFKVRYK